MSEITNPFIVGRYVGGKYFCDRERETNTLLHHIENGRDVALVSPRRMGKSGLIRHFFDQDAVKSNYYTFYVDIYDTTSLNDFIVKFGREVYSELRRRSSKYLDKFFSLVKSLRAGFKIDSVSGEPVFELSLGDIVKPEKSLDEIFAYLNSADHKCIIAIDEFQQIRNYPEKNVEAILRTKIQQCVNALFIYSGSKRSVMTNIFVSKSKPFYNSAITMSLDPIAIDTYVDFARSHFDEAGKTLDKSTAMYVYERFRGITWFLQMTMNETFAITPMGQTADNDIVESAIDNLILAQNVMYSDMIHRLSSIQRNLLSVIANNRVVARPTSAGFIRQNRLQSASSVQSALRKLLELDIVTRDEEGYRIYDIFFAEWLRRADRYS